MQAYSHCSLATRRHSAARLARKLEAGPMTFVPCPRRQTFWTLPSPHGCGALPAWLLHLPPSWQTKPCATSMKCLASVGGSGWKKTRQAVRRRFMHRPGSQLASRRRVGTLMTNTVSRGTHRQPSWPALVWPQYLGALSSGFGGCSAKAAQPVPRQNGTRVRFGISAKAQ